MAIINRFMSLLTAALMLLSSIAISIGGTPVNSYSFSVDCTGTGRELSNVVSNVNVWDISGNPFVNATVNEKSNVFEFVEYVQFMQCTGGNVQRDLFVDPLDRTVLDDYDFSTLLNNCEGVLALGAKPHLKLGSVPLKYSSDADANSTFGVNVYPPDDYDVYFNYIAAVAKALVDRFGLSQVQSWRFGVMTEYENADWFRSPDGDPEKAAVAYCKLYDYTVAALEQVLGDDIFVGAHSMSVTEGLWDEALFINHCASGINYKTGEKGTRICFLSASFYDSRPGEYTSGKTAPETAAYLRDTAEAAGLHGLIYGFDEGRILCGNSSGTIGSELFSRTCGYTYQAAYDARIIKQLFDNGINYFSSWGYLSGGLLTGNPTVSYHVAENAAAFAGAHTLKVNKNAPLITNGAEVEAFAALDKDGSTVRIMAYNFKNNLKYSRSADTEITLNMPALNGKKVCVKSYVIDDDCNFFDEWQEDRVKYGIGDDCFSWSPDDPWLDQYTTLTDQRAREIYFNELYDKYSECSRLEPTEQSCAVENGKVTFTASLGANTVVFYEITAE